MFGLSSVAVVGPPRIDIFVPVALELMRRNSPPSYCAEAEIYCGIAS